MKYELEYRQDGVKKVKVIFVDFVSQGMLRKYNQIQGETTALAIRWEKINDNATKIVALKSTREEGYKEKIKELKAQNDESVTYMQSITDDGFFKDWINLLKDIFKNNGVKEEIFYSDDFWYDCVHANHAFAFLTEIIAQDMPKKKAMQI